MSSDLQNSPMGVLALRRGMLDQVERRLRRWFKTHTVRTYDDWIASGKTVFDFGTVLGELNLAHDSEAIALLDLLARFESETITQDLDIYVNTVTGSDVTGDGSEDAPLGTFMAAQRLIPRYINSKINIFLSTGVPGANNPVTEIQNMYVDFGYQGQLTIQGIDEPDIIDGPHTVSVWGDIGVAMEYGHSIQVAAPTWVAQAKVGQFIHVLTGAQAGSYYAIAQNTADTLYIANTYYKLSPGDTFEIVVPTTEFNISPDYECRTFCIRHEIDYIPNISRFGMFGLNFTNFSYLEVNLNSAKAIFGFVIIDYLLLTGTLGDIGHYDLAFPDEVIQDKLRLNDYPFLYSQFVENHVAELALFRVSCHSIFNIGARVFLADSSFGDCGISVGTCIIDRCFNVPGGFYGTPVAAQTYPALGKINGLWLNYVAAGNAVDWSAGGEMVVDDLEGTSPTNYAFLLGAGTRMQFNGTPVTGTVNDVQWVSTGAAAAYPGGAGTNINDTNGAYCVKLS